MTGLQEDMLKPDDEPAPAAAAGGPKPNAADLYKKYSGGSD
jgi:hypothetical protein